MNTALIVFTPSAVNTIGVRTIKSKNYYEFVKKFKPKKTTDDCYTPPKVYEAVCSWVCNEYGVERENFVRPFYPGGDYENYVYKDNDIVVDNPPFSILSKIIKFYTYHGIKFFLFAPALTLFSPYSEAACFISVNCDVIYENGAKIRTSFITNLEQHTALRSAPFLYNLIDSVVKEGKKTKNIPKYSYPPEVLMAWQLGDFSKYGIEFKADHKDIFFIEALDSQKKMNVTIYGRGFLLSKEKTAEKILAEKVIAEKKVALQWDLSTHELDIIKSLGVEKPPKIDPQCFLNFEKN